MPRRRLSALALALVLAAILPAPSAHAAVPVVVVDGRGHGHGVGMAQDGAYWMGQQGATTQQILDHFYPGTTVGSAKGDLRVVVFVSGDGRAVVSFPDGGELRSPRSGAQRPGFPVQVAPGGTATVTYDGTYRVESASGVSAQGEQAQVIPLPTTPTSSTSSTSTTTTTLLPLGPPSTTSTTAPSAPGATTTTTAPPPGRTPRPVTSPEPIWAGPVRGGGTVGVPARGLRYRGELELSAATGTLRIVNQIDVEQYLWGLGEVSASWSPAALRAQVIAARTYAMRAMAANGEICDTQRCQVYRGATGEFAGQVDAVNATLGAVLSYGGHYASTVFSANAAGVSATPEEGFGTSNASHPYLVAAPYQSESNVTFQVRIGLADLARRLGYTGTATSFTVASKGPSGRPLEVEIGGDRGPLRVRALAVDSAMGLRSTMWDAHVEAADAAPVAPDAAQLIQTEPDDVGQVIAAEQHAAIARRVRQDRADRLAQRSASRHEPGRDGSHGAVPWLLVGFVLLAGGAGVWVLRTADGPDPGED
jgi:SpoIID/LytB domain protein